jgi:hypothetical protein
LLASSLESGGLLESRRIPRSTCSDGVLGGMLKSRVGSDYESLAQVLTVEEKEEY